MSTFAIVYQPLIVGLGAVVLATAGNTALEWYRQNLQDRRQAGAVRRAFAEELRAHRRMFAAAMSDEQRAELEGSFMVPIDRFQPVYDNMIGKIGLLAPDEAGAVLKAYSYIILSPKNLFLIGRVHRDDFASFIEVPVKYKAVLHKLNATMVEVIDDALRQLRC